MMKILTSILTVCFVVALLIGVALLGKYQHKNLNLPICLNQCGDSICSPMVCSGQGCPCPETKFSCPGDCN
jgi:hypothetical protein